MSTENTAQETAPASALGSARGVSRLSAGEREDYHDALAEIERLRARVEAMRESAGQVSALGVGGGSDAALGYAQRLARSMWQMHWQTDAPNWKPLNDTLGVLTQIDNMVAGMERKKITLPVDN